MNDRIHFHSIDALRFFAFLKVYFLHVPIQGDFPVFGFLKGGGGIGVSFFFVLSGFLITYLLVKDKLRNGQINLRNFLVRRSLRIWPLFYLMVIIAFTLPYDFRELIGFHMVGGGYDPDWKYSFTFMENYKALLEDRFPKVTPLPVFWSLCIEEHFYIVWMISIFFIPHRHIMKYLVGCVALSWVARIIEPHIFHNENMESIDLFTNMDFFAVGGMLGYYVAKDFRAVINYVYRFPEWARWLTVFVAIGMVITQKIILPNEGNFVIFRSTVIAVVFTALIAVLIPPDSRIAIRNRTLAYLGHISYGLYVYHIIVIHVTFQYCLGNDIKLDNWVTLGGYILLTFVASVLISALSYRYFEKPFLRLRERLTQKQSIPDAGI